MILIVLGVAGGVGSVARFLVDGAVTRRWPRITPVGTLVINVTGSFLLGALTGSISHVTIPHARDLIWVLGTGLCGGYTTFSTASVDTARLWLDGGHRRAARYLTVSVVGSIAAAALGMWLGVALAAAFGAR